MSRPWESEPWSTFRDTAPPTTPLAHRRAPARGALASSPPRRRKARPGSAIGISLALAARPPVRRRRYAVPEPRDVLYVALEGSQTGLRARIGALARGIGLDPDGDRSSSGYRCSTGRGRSTSPTSRPPMAPRGGRRGRRRARRRRRAPRRPPGSRRTPPRTSRRSATHLEPLLADERTVALLHHFGEADRDAEGARARRTDGRHRRDVRRTRRRLPHHQDPKTAPAGCASSSRPATSRPPTRSASSSSAPAPASTAASPTRHRHAGSRRDRRRGRATSSPSSSAPRRRAWRTVHELARQGEGHQREPRRRRRRPHRVAPSDSRRSTGRASAATSTRNRGARSGCSECGSDPRATRATPAFSRPAICRGNVCPPKGETTRDTRSPSTSGLAPELEPHTNGHVDPAYFDSLAGDEEALALERAELGR